MRKAIIFLCVGVLSVVAYPSFAQIKYGVKVGVSSNSIGFNFEDSVDKREVRRALKSKPGFTVGLAAEYGFTDALSLQTGLQLTNKGFKTEAEEDGVFYKSKTSVNYLEIPVHLAYKMSKFQLHAGPYVGVGLFGKTKYEYKYGGRSETEETKFKFKNKASERDYYYLDSNEGYMRLIDIGLNLGAGYRFGPVLLTATYSKGLSNLSPKNEDEYDDNDKETNKGFSLAATWFFR